MFTSDNARDNSAKRKHKRGGAKPQAATILKRRLIENKVEEAEASFAFLVAVRNNDAEPSALRVAAAEQILDRVLGKPTQMTKEAGDELYREHLARLKRVIFDEPDQTQR